MKKLLGLALAPVLTLAWIWWRLGRMTAAAIFLVFATVALEWVLVLLYASARSLVKGPLALEKARATGRRKKELERDKQRLLKALKELEFDHEMGKISDADFHEIGGQYRGRAMRAMRELDRADSAIDYRDLVERDLQGRTRTVESKANACAKCSTRNDADAEFCKRCGGKLGAAVALVVALLFAGWASAQPMMVDPSKMSGIPRPDPQVSVGTITVRLIRGELSNRVTGHPVELVDQNSGETRTVSTDENGRATFSELSGGPFVARAVDPADKAEERISQPIALAPTSGVRVMLVFAPPVGAADGAAHLDPSLPAHTVVVRVVGDGGAPLAGVDVVLGMSRKGEEGVAEHKGKTDDKGEARFSGLDTKPTSGYLAEAVKEGTRFASKPFRLSDEKGSLVVLEVRPVSHDLSQLTVGSGSHFILEVNDDSVQVAEVLRLVNGGTSPIDVPGGLHLPLPDKAVSATSGSQASPQLTVQGHEAVWKGPIPPGDTEVQLLFVLAYQGDRLEIRQPAPLAFAAVAAVTEKIEGMSLDGSGLVSEERPLQGRHLVLYRGPGVPAGGEIKLTLVGLPHSDPTFRLMAALLALGIVIGFGIYAARGAPASERGKLEEKREHLLSELAALDGKGALDDKRRRKREELADRLVEVYRQLDEVG